MICDRCGKLGEAYFQTTSTDKSVGKSLHIAVLSRLGFVFGMGFGLAAFIGRAANLIDTEWATYLLLFGLWNLCIDIIGGLKRD